MAARGTRIRFRQSDMLKHIGGFTEVGALPDALLYSRGRLDRIAHDLGSAPGRALLRIADAWYAVKHGPKENGLRENLNLASRIRRRTTTARYFYLLIVGLMDDKQVPAVPMLGDPVAERRLQDATADIKTLINSVRNNPGPWQDPA